MSEPSRHLRYWAKTLPEGGFHPVLYHCLDVAAVGRALLEARPRALARLAAVSGLSAETLLALLPLLLSFHDLGKLADGFQCQVPELMAELQGELRAGIYGDHYRHDSMGFVLLDDQLERHLAFLVPASLREAFANSWLAAAMGHHGRPPVVAGQHAELKRQFPPAVAEDLAATLAELRALFLPQGLAGRLDPDEFLDRSPLASWLFAGLAVEADWLGSNPTFFPPNRQDHSARSYFEQIALPAAVTAVAAAGLTEQPLSAPRRFAQLWPAYQATPLQQLADSLELAPGPQLIVIEEVTGGGKTEAAFTLAHRLIAAGAGDGLYLGLPTMATANAMYDRLGGRAGNLFAENANPSVVLAHGSRELRLEQLQEAARRERRIENESASLQCSSWLADSRKKALLAEVGIGTIDQALLGVLQARHQSLRLWGLAGKVLVVDEVHAADAYMQQLLGTLLEAHAAFGSSAILLSATLPRCQRARLMQAFARGAGYRVNLPAEQPYPALLHLSSTGLAVHSIAARQEASRTLTVRLLHQESEVEKVLRETLEEGGCACWIRNTVGDAIASWEHWAKLWGADRVELFHARFTVADRHQIESRVLARFGKDSDPAGRRGRLLIATQVVEQSLDLDFDTLISDLAPADLLVQRAGRLRRHARDRDGCRTAEERRGEPVFHIFTPADSPEIAANWVSSLLPGTARIYPDHGRLWAGVRYFTEEGKLRIPADLRRLIETVYSPDSELQPPAALETISERADGKAKADRSTAASNQISLSLGYQPTGVTSSWRDDVSTPTRLGEPTVRLRLARRRGDSLLPLAAGNRGWELSEVSVRQARVAAEAKADAALIEKAKTEMRDHGKWAIVVVLREGPEGLEGEAEAADGKPVRIRYSEQRGLEVFKVS